jgi:hypothetical protein
MFKVLSSFFYVFWNMYYKSACYLNVNVVTDIFVTRLLSNVLNLKSLKCIGWKNNYISLVTERFHDEDVNINVSLDHTLTFLFTAW